MKIEDKTSQPTLIVISLKKGIRNLYQRSESVILGVGKGKIRKQYNCDARITLRDNGPVMADVFFEALALLTSI